MCYHCRGKTREERVELHKSYGDRKMGGGSGTSNVSMWQGPAVGSSEARFAKHLFWELVGVTPGGARVLKADASDGVWLRMVKWIPGVSLPNNPSWSEAEKMPLYAKVFIHKKEDSPQVRTAAIEEMENTLDMG